MELNDAYALANVLNEKVMEGVLDRGLLSDITITATVPPTILYGMDREFYRMSHGDSLEGFVHAPKVYASIDGIPFVFEAAAAEVRK